MNEDFKKKVEKVAKVLGGITCTIIGMMIGGFGVKQLIPEKKYHGGTVGNYKTVSSDTPEKEE